MILFMMTFLFVYTSYRYYSDIKQLNKHILEREAYISMLENDMEWYEQKVDLLCEFCEENKGMGEK